MAVMTSDIEMRLAWRYASGAALERFCAGLRERRIAALRCDGCGRRYLPPRPFCGNCRLRLESWVEVADEGRLEGWTRIHTPIVDGRTGEPRPSPYAIGLIRLDGADTTINHYLADGGADLAIGRRVRARWRENLRGSMDDIACFEVLP